jgi:hypothetical protein
VSRNQKVPFTQPDFARREGHQDRPLHVHSKLGVPYEGSDRSKRGRRDDIEKLRGRSIHPEYPSVGGQSDHAFRDRVDEGLKLGSFPINLLDALSGIGVELPEEAFEFTQFGSSLLREDQAPVTAITRTSSKTSRVPPEPRFYDAASEPEQERPQDPGRGDQTDPSLDLLRIEAKPEKEKGECESPASQESDPASEPHPTSL